MLGLTGRKLGMGRVFESSGKVKPVTFLQFDRSLVIGEKTQSKNGYDAVVLATEDLRLKKKSLTRNGVLQEVLANSTRAHLGQFGSEAERLPLKRYIYEIKGLNGDYPRGKELGVGVFSESRFVDVVGLSKGKGFQGGMKRHGFSGGPRSHGSKFHRGLGATGVGANNVARLWPGTKLPGRMGGARRTVQNLAIVSLDEEKGVLAVQGSVPGPKMGRVLVRVAKKKQ